MIRFRDPSADSAAITDFDRDDAYIPPSQAQRRVLVALCRPFAVADRAHPATNRQIAEELYLSVDS